MVHKTVLVTTFGRDAQIADRLCKALQDQWRGRAIIETIECDAIPSPNVLRRVAAIVVHLGAKPMMRETLALIENAEHAGVPVLVLTEDDRTSTGGTFAGALAMPVSSDQSLLCATLEGLMHASADARRLRADLSLAHRTSGGLEGEIVKMHEELQLAAMVQRELLPRELPEVHGVSFGTLWRPANYVSGDIFDVIRLDEDHIGLFLADSVGHGVPAALMTMVISRSLIMKEVDGDAYRILPPSEILSRLNAELLLRQGRTTRFATAVCAVVDCRNRVMQLAGAGHPSPILVHGNGEMIELDCGGGGLLGIFEDEPYEQVEVELELNDRILFYSDGFEQAFPTHSCDAYERMLPTTHYRTEFQDIARQPTPTQMIERLRNRLDVQQGSLHQADDLTLICMFAGQLEIESSDHITSSGASSNRWQASRDSQLQG